MSDLAAAVEAVGEDFLDEAVHDAKSIEGSRINNGGIDEQIEYLGEDFVRDLLLLRKQG